MEAVAGKGWPVVSQVGLDLDGFAVGADGPSQVPLGAKDIGQSVVDLGNFCAGLRTVIGDQLDSPLVGGDSPDQVALGAQRTGQIGVVPGHVSLNVRSEIGLNLHGVPESGPGPDQVALSAQEPGKSQIGVSVLRPDVDELSPNDNGLIEVAQSYQGSRQIAVGSIVFAVYGDGFPVGGDGLLQFPLCKQCNPEGSMGTGAPGIELQGFPARRYTVLRARQGSVLGLQQGPTQLQVKPIVVVAFIVRVEYPFDAFATCSDGPLPIALGAEQGGQPTVGTDFFGTKLDDFPVLGDRLVRVFIRLEDPSKCDMGSPGRLELDHLP